MSQDNNEAASAPGLQSRINAELAKVFKDDPANACRAHAAITAALAASASQPSTAGAAKGGNTSNEIIVLLEDIARWPGDGGMVRANEFVARAKSALAHVARQRQESIPELHNIAEVTRPSDQTLHLRFMSCRSASAFHHFITDKAVFAESTPSSAVAEGVDTAHLRELVEQYRHVKNRYHARAAEEKEVDVSLADLAAFCAQQREAGRRERDAEIARLRTRVEDLIDIVCQKSGEVGRLRKAAREALARQPVSEGLTDSAIIGVFSRIQGRWSNFGGPINAILAFARAILSAVPPAKAEGLTFKTVEEFYLWGSQGNSFAPAFEQLHPDAKAAWQRDFDARIAQQAKKGGAA